MIAAVDIGGTKIATGLVNDLGAVLVAADMPVNCDCGPRDATRRILNALRTQIQATGIPLKGIGIGCTGPVDPGTGELGEVNTLRGWRGWNPVQELAEAFHVQVAIENDADAAALGEMRWGAGKGKRSVVYIIVGTGIGAGIVLNGEIYRGAHDSHPELGHHIVEPLGPACTCGATGCWESLASGPALERWFARQQPTTEMLTAKEICSRARTGDVRAIIAVDRLGKYLGMGIANVISMLMPERIVLGGSVMQSADLFLDRIRATVQDKCRLVPAARCDVALASLGNSAGLIGAAQVWHHRFRSPVSQAEVL